MNLSCTPGASVPLPLPANYCLCTAAYYGSECESVLSWWFPLNTFNHVFEGLLLIFALIWAIRVVIKKIQKRRLVSLAGVALSLEILSTLVRIAWLCLPGVELVAFSTNQTYVIVAGVLLPLSIVLWLASAAIIMAFWHEIWSSKTKASGSIARSTKISLIVSSIVFFICTLIGLIYLDAVTELGFLIYYVPLGVIILVLLGFTIRLSRFNIGKLSTSLKAKHSWTMRLFIALIVNWSIYYITLGAYIFTSNSPVSMAELILFRLTEAIAAILNMALLDYQARALRSSSSEPLSRTSILTTPSAGSQSSSKPGSTETTPSKGGDDSES